MAFIEIHSLTHTYPSLGRDTGLEALRGVDLEIESGEYVALVGANGSGKTTLGRHLNALLEPTSGHVVVDGRDTMDPQTKLAIRRDVGMVFQDPADQIVATVVEDDVAFGPENIGIPADRLSALVDEALAWTGMADARERPPHLLSAGQQQRVAISAVLAMKPRCLVLDESTAMLDPRGASDLLDLVDRLRSDGMTIVTITHRMEEAARAARVVVLHQGRVVADGLPDEVLLLPDLGVWGLAPPPLVSLTARLHELVPDLPTSLQIEVVATALAEALR